MQNDKDAPDANCGFKTPNPTKDDKKRKRVRIACQNCQRSHTVCDDGRPCKRCARLGLSDCRDAEKGMSERWHRSRSANAESARKRSKSWDFESKHGEQEDVAGFNPAAGLEYQVGIHSSISSVEEDGLSSSDTEYFPYADVRRHSFDDRLVHAHHEHKVVQAPQPTLETAVSTSSSIETPVQSPSNHTSATDAQICVHLDGQYMSLQALPSYFPLETRLSAILHLRQLLEQNLRWVDSVANSMQQRSQFHPQAFYYQPYGDMTSSYTMMPQTPSIPAPTCGYYSEVLATGDQDGYTAYYA